LSVEHVEEGRLEGLELGGAKVLAVSRHGNRLRLGHLRGNRFRMLLRGIDESHRGALQENLQWMQQHGVANWFGEQRFGKRGANVDKGLQILRGNPKSAAYRMPRRLFGLLVSAVQSEVFNRVLAARVRGERGLDPGVLADGDVAFLHDRGACFPVPDAAAEQARCMALEISPTGPLPGPDILPAEGMPAEQETVVLEAMNLDSQAFGRLPRKSHPGARRPLRVPLTDAAVEPGQSGLWLTFALPAGSFATAALQDLLTTTRWFR
jgi:tRNA pseudouridine13 synthase